MRHNELTDEVFPHGYHFKDGFMYLTDAPGLGVDFNEELAAKYEYTQANLLVNRLSVGRMFHW
jgi:mannonate dehydratase